jgi:MarR family transcriptional regulator, lower aerobic nicotinate degradation pathway regulator
MRPLIAEAVPARVDHPVDESRLWAALWSVLCQLGRRLRRSARTIGLTPPQIWILQTIQAFGPVSSGELARELDVTLPSITSSINHLENLGYVRRTRPPGDRRKVIISISPSGTRQIHRLWALRRAEEQRIASHLSRQDRAELAGLLERLGRELASGGRDRANLFSSTVRRKNDAR